MIDIKNKLFVLSIVSLLFLMLYGCNSKEIDNQHIEKEINELQKEEDMNLKL